MPTQSDEVFSQSDIERFWDKVDHNGPIHPTLGQCWVWTSAKRTGYGLFTITRDRKRKSLGAHRVSYELEYGSPQGRVVRHECDNPPCVRPAHLRLGSHLDNSNDKMTRDRHHGVLRNEQVLDIRSREYTDTILREVATEFGVDEDTARRALTGETYSFLPGGRPLPRQKSKRKLTEEEVEEIRTALQVPYWGIQLELAGRYNVSRNVIQRIQYGTY